MTPCYFLLFLLLCCGRVPCIAFGHQKVVAIVVLVVVPVVAPVALVAVLPQCCSKHQHSYRE